MRNPFAFLKFRIYRRTFYTYCVIMLLLIGSVSGAMLFNAHAMGLAQFSSEADSNFSVLKMKRQNVLSRIDRLFFRIYASRSLETDFSGFFGATPEEYMRSRLNRWEVFEAFNDAAQESALLGFMANYTAYTDIFEEVSGIYEKYYSALITGTVDPEIYVSRMNRELSDAGLDLLQQELQRQIDHWLAAHPASGALSDLDG